MTRLYNEVLIDASIESIWQALANMQELEKYDPTVEKVTVLTNAIEGIGAKRKVAMRDGRNWFEEECTLWKPNQALTYQLVACSFPVHKLKHTYSFEQTAGKIKVQQIMEYKIKYGFLGRVLDALIVRKKSDSGVKLFFKGLKEYLEKQPEE